MQEKIRLMKKYSGHKMCFIFLCCVYFIYFPLQCICSSYTQDVCKKPCKPLCKIHYYCLIFINIWDSSVRFPENLFISQFVTDVTKLIATVVYCSIANLWKMPLLCLSHKNMLGDVYSILQTQMAHAYSLSLFYT